MPGGLLVDYCARVGAVAVLKGVRGSTDIDYEQPMAQMNRHLSGLETVYLPGDPSWLHVSGGLGTSPYAQVRFACRPEATLLTLTGIDSSGSLS